MPLCYGGGIKTISQAMRIIDIGVEKIAMSSAAIERPELVSEISSTLGKQSVVTVLDLKEKKGLFTSKYEVCTLNATKKN